MEILKNLPLALFGNLSPAELTRYDKQLRLADRGLSAQEKLKNSRVSIAGAGRLMSSSAFNLVAAGVGHVRIVDAGRLLLRDLGDQMLFWERDLNKPKVSVLQQRLRDEANLSNIYVAMNAIFNQALEGAPGFADQVAMLVPSQGRANDYKFMLQFLHLREWIGDRQVGNLAGAGFHITNKDYEATIEVYRNDIEDDAIGLYNPLIAELGWAARQHTDLLVAALLAQGHTAPFYDGENFSTSAIPAGPRGRRATTAAAPGCPGFFWTRPKALNRLSCSSAPSPSS